jgi:hypothetical protein
MQTIVFTNERGFVSLCNPAPNVSVEYVLQNDVPANSDAQIFDLDSLPIENNDFFNAWKLINGQIVVDIPEAILLTKTRLRFERAQVFQVLDVAFMRALEMGQSTAEIVAEKQRLRDITNLADLETTVAGLRALKAELQITI